MNTDRLEMPIWWSLEEHHAFYRIEQGGMRRFVDSALPVIAASAPEADADPEIWCPAGKRIAFLQHRPPALPAGLRVVLSADGVQMVAGPALQTALAPDPDIVPLGENDLDAMMTLAEKAKPGPITRHALAIGRFWGIRREGRLAAMAGERMRMAGYTELSGVATDPDYRGQGLARRLTVHVAAEILKTGAQPFLHAFATNETAIRLYESIGFLHSRSVNYTLIERA